MEQTRNLPSQNKPSTDLVVLFDKATKVFNNLLPEVKALMSGYPSKGKEKVYPTLYNACMEDAPSLAMIDKKYGDTTSIIWLAVQLVHVAMYTGIGEKLKWEQLEETAKHLRNLSAEFGVTLPELMVFFSRFEQGNYQQFVGYERPNPQVIMKSFQYFLHDDFIETRMRVSEEQKAERLRKERAEAKANAVPPPPHIQERLDKFIKTFGK